MDSSSSSHQGWEPIWASGSPMPRYESFAEPHPGVIELAAMLPSGASIADIGCGAGRHLTYLGGVGRGFQLAGVDISPTGIKRAQAACAERGITFDAHVSDVTRLPWEDATFDAAFSIATIHHHLRADIQKAVDEVRRVLKPGGIFLVDLLCVGTIPYNRSRQQVTTGESVEVEPNTFVDERPDSEDSDGFLPHHYFDEADARDLLRDFEIMRFMSGADDIVLENGERRSSGKWVVWAHKPQQA